MPQSSSLSPGTNAARARSSASVAASHTLIPRPAVFDAQLEGWPHSPAARTDEIGQQYDRSNRRAIQSALRAERKRIARDIHDYSEQLIVAMTLQLARLEQNPDDARSQCALLRRTLADLDEGLRRISNGLRLASTCNGTLPITLSRLAERWTTDTGIRVELDLEAIEFRDPGGRIGTVLAHVAQMMLNNVVKHATNTPYVHIRLYRHEEAVAVSVEDKGPGFDPTKTASRNAGRVRSGLIYMQEHLAEIGGRLAVDSAVGMGTRATALVPVGGCP